MHHVIELHLDSASELKLSELSAALRGQGLDTAAEIVGVRPHITLCSSSPIPIDKIETELDQICSVIPVLDLGISYAGFFFNRSNNLTLYAGVSPSIALCQLQESIFKLVSKFTESVFDFVRPGFMVYHSTLSHALPKSRTSEALDLVSRAIPFRASVTRLAIVEYFPAHELLGFPLDSGACR